MAIDKKTIEDIALGYYMQKDAEQGHAIQPSITPEQMQELKRMREEEARENAPRKLLEKWRAEHYHS